MESGSAAAEDSGAPESWELADLDASVSRLMLDTKKESRDAAELAPAPTESSLSSSSSSSLHVGLGEKDSEDALSQVDQFLREALQNPRERLSILRMEQEVERFIRDPTQQQFEFPQFPTSYLRLAAHRVAQHYLLQSMVLLDNNNPDGSGSRIIVRKTAECRLPLIRLADIPANLPSEESSVIKVAIKQRPQKRSSHANSGNSNSLKGNSSKSVEERKDEYNKARARIFSGNSTGSGAIGRSESEPRLQDNSQHVPLVNPKMDEHSGYGISNMSSNRGLMDSSTSGRMGRNRIEKEPIGRYNNYRPNNRIAIFRDREVDRKDPDYDRNYDRYMQRFDPGFGFNGGQYAIQPMYSPAINYNTEFPQLGAAHRPQMPAELSQHLPGQWTATSASAGVAYAHHDPLMAPFNPNHVGVRSTAGMYLHSSQFPSQRPGVPFISHEHAHQPFSQPHQQSDASFGLARPR